MKRRTWWIVGGIVAVVIIALVIFLAVRLLATPATHGGSGSDDGRGSTEIALPEDEAQAVALQYVVGTGETRCQLRANMTERQVTDCIAQLTTKQQEQHADPAEVEVTDVQKWRDGYAVVLSTSSEFGNYESVGLLLENGKWKVAAEGRPESADLSDRAICESLSGDLGESSACGK